MLPSVATDNRSCAKAGLAMYLQSRSKRLARIGSTRRRGTDRGDEHRVGSPRRSAGLAPPTRNGRPHGPEPWPGGSRTTAPPARRCCGLLGTALRVGERVAYAMWQTRHPLANRQFGEHVIHEVSRHLRQWGATCRRLTPRREQVEPCAPTCSLRTNGTPDRPSP